LIPIIGKLTAANKKSQRRATPAMVTVKDRSPQQGMWRLSAAVGGGVGRLPGHDGEGRAGIDEITAAGHAVGDIEEAAGAYRRNHAPAP
jgi:hypothetical protein